MTLTKAEIRERKRLKFKKWKIDFPDRYEQHKEYVKAWRLRNPEKIKKYNKNYRERHAKRT
jgi:hypothetical protein